MELLQQLDISEWQGPFPPVVAAQAVDALESGRLLYAPQLQFELTDSERRFLSEDCLDGKAKNISFRPGEGVLRGSRFQGAECDELRSMLERFCNSATALLEGLCPNYANHLKPGFASFRPVEIAGRSTSWRHDDTRLHVDGFPSRPLQGLRILRIFNNVNPQSPRIWRVGEPFETAASKFLPQVPRPVPGSATLLHLLRITKSRRTEYDHFMLGIHDRMKADQAYQAGVPQTQLAFPPGSTWACFTDCVSHAAMSGQFAFEQTFYLPVSAMKDPQRSPLRVLERLANRALV